MRHTDSQAIFSYWSGKRGGRAAPARSDIEPGDIRKLLPQIFIGETDLNDDVVFRLAGTGLCALAGHELKGKPLTGLWLPDGQRNASRALRSAMARAMPLVISADLLTKGGRVCEIEIVTLPLLGPSGEHDRMIGLVSVFDPPFWLGHDDLSGLSTRALRFLDLARDPVFLANRPELTLPRAGDAQAVPPADAGRKTAHLIVLEGGRRD